MEITIRKGTFADTEALISLLQDVWQRMENKDWLYLDNPKYIREMMSSGTMQLWVATADNQIVASFSILIPGMHPFNYGYDLKFKEAALHQVVNMDTIAVHPDYRGKGLQHKLMTEAENWAFANGYSILLCTVHPENRYSLQNMLKLGYTICKELPMYGSTRYILRKDRPNK